MIRYGRLSCIVMLIMAAAACSLHDRRDIALPGDIPGSFVEDRQDEGRERPAGRWWKAFNDPVLDDLMAQAFHGNPGVEQARARLEQVQALNRSASSALWPSLSLEARAGREDTPGFLGSNAGDSYRLALAASYELDVWQKYRSRAQAADWDARASKEDIKALYMTLSSQVADLYYLSVEQRAQTDLVDKTIETLSDTLERVESRYRAGIAPALDVYQARLNLSGVRARRKAYEATLAVTEHALGVLLGKYPGRGYSGDLISLPAVPESFPSGIPSEVISMRPDVRAAIYRLRAGDERIAAAVADRFPSFNILANYGRSGSAFSTGDIEGTFWSILLNAVAPLIDAGKRKAEVDRTEAVYREMLSQYHGAVLRAFQEVEDALARSRSGEEAAAILAEREKTAGSALRLSLDRYMQGLSDYLPVLAAQAVHFDVQSRLIENRRELLSSRIQLERALGGTWMEEEFSKRITDRPKNTGEDG